MTVVLGYYKDGKHHFIHVEKKYNAKELVNA